MKSVIRGLINRLGFEIARRKPASPREGMVSLVPGGPKCGDVLLSYVIDPFLLREGEPISNAHTHDWESFQMAATFLHLGYAVDVIDYDNGKFVPEKDYSLLVSARTNFQRIAQLLNDDCLKIVHLDTAHWLYNNTAAYQRCLALQQRRGVTLKSFKWVEPNWAIEYADYATILGNDFTIDTYQYAQKPIFRIPISTCAVYPSPENKNWEFSRKHFLWFGSSGMVHKGLDLVLEAFAGMPDHHLYVCGPVSEEEDFEKAYHHELHETLNIHPVGWVDVEGAEFKDITDRCIGMVYPSCCEGGGGSVVNCMHAGLIPIVSYESSVDVVDFGFILKESTVEEIRKSIQRVSSLPLHELRSMALRTWEYAAANHTRERFAFEYASVVKRILNESGRSWSESA